MAAFRLFFLILLFALRAECALAFSHGWNGPPRDANGFSMWTPRTGTGTCVNSSGSYTGSCGVLVDPVTGNDATCASITPPFTSFPNPCKTYTGALAKTRTFGGHDDWLLIKNGATVFWQASDTTPGWAGKGHSPQHPFVISSWPIMNPTNPADRATIDFINGPSFASLLSVNGVNVFTAIQGIRITNTGRDPLNASWNRASMDAQSGGIGNAFSNCGIFWVENVELDFLNSFNFGLTAPGTILCPIRWRRVSQFAAYATTNNQSGGFTPPPRNSDNQNCQLGGGAGPTIIEESFMQYCGFYPPSQGNGGTVTMSAAGVGQPILVTWIDLSCLPGDPTSCLPPTGQPSDKRWVAFASTGTLMTPLVNVAGSDCGLISACVVTCNTDLTNHTANISTDPTCATVMNATSLTQSGTITAYWYSPTTDVFSQGVYDDLAFDGCTSNCEAIRLSLTQPTIARNNIISYVSNIGLQLRGGGTVINNLLYANAAQLTCCAIPSTIEWNVAFQSSGIRYLPTGVSEQFGFEVSSYTCSTPASTNCPSVWSDKGMPTPGAAGSLIQYNIGAHSNQSHGPNGSPFHLYPAGNTGLGFSVPATTNITVQFNIGCDWPSASNQPIHDEGSGNIIGTNYTDTGSGPTSCQNAVPAAPAPNRTLGQYVDFITGVSGHTDDDFLAIARTAMLSDHYDPRYMAPAVNSWIRAGFGNIPDPP